MNYVEIIKYAIFLFPVIAFIMSFPFILYEYHKYGSISFLKAFIIYSLTFYLLCAYFLVILPLPKISEVELLTTPRTQLIPFKFICDFVSHTSLNILDIHTYIKALKKSWFYVPVFNIFLTLPFGVYLSYYFKCDLKKTTLYTFLLSLFFELTQLSGLYFIYPRGYRLFDVDDLILNTTGGIIGFLVAKWIKKILPSRDEIDKKAIENGKTLSGFRRTTAFLFDFFIFSVINIILILIFKHDIYIFYAMTIIYYFIIPLFKKGSTCGQSYLNIKIVDYSKKYKVFRVIFRRLLFIIIYIGIPLLILYYIGNINKQINEFIGCLVLFIYFIFDMVSGFKYLFSNKRLIFEKISKTKMESTIGNNEM